MSFQRWFLTAALAFSSSYLSSAAEKPKLTLDEFFNSVGFDAVRISPDGRSVVMVTDRADWDQSVYRTDLWLYREGDPRGLFQLTQSGQESSPEWSPDGRWIAFVSERKNPRGRDRGEEDEATGQLYLISPTGGEAIPVTRVEEGIHAFTWSADSRTLFFATRTPWTQEQKDAHKKEWHDVVRYREDERGDEIFSLDVADAIARQAAEGMKPAQAAEDASVGTPGAHVLAGTPWRVHQLVGSPDGRRLAFASESVSERVEKIAEFEIYTVEISGALAEKAPHQVTHNEAQENNIRWASDSRHIFFQVEYGSVEGKYSDTQERLYWVDADSGEVQRWAKDFGGMVIRYALAPNGGVITEGRVGTEVQMYSQLNPSAAFVRLSGWQGTYESTSSAEQSVRIAFVHSTLDKPSEVYLADGVNKLAEARPITSFNQIFTQRELPRGKTYQWKADDGTTIEGMLMYPPGKFEAKNLPMFVCIHGGPDDADGNHFEADWYVWDRLAAAQGWLVFEPNYRGSTGYGDVFLQQSVPEMVSRPGKDVLEGVDALVKDGIADPNRLAVGGYSFGGYLTNWLITQTTRFKAAVTGAGAVENVAEWGNDDDTLDDANSLGGTPWAAAQRYHDEAAIFQIDKVRTPTHIVSGSDDIRVATLQSYLLEHALHELGIPSTLLIFPGEDHSLGKNPWSGKIKVREELKWLQTYGGAPASQ
jgi:dipeptidyl aminopeptidase/acylaminoacyl peptidase